jgi:predicted RNA-binding Zn ribbon-like protein
MPAAAIPAHALLLRDFANTLDVDEGTDALIEASEVTAWLREHDLLESPVPAGDDDLALARELREAVRAAFSANHDDPSPDQARAQPSTRALEHVGAGLPLALQVCGGRPFLEPLETGVRGALTRLLVAAADAGADGSWRRLKICAADECAWAFYDTSKNQSRTWCSMSVCGNRAKTRSYRARRSADDPPRD